MTSEPKIHLIPKGAARALCNSRVREPGRLAVTTRRQLEDVEREGRCAKCQAIVNRITKPVRERETAMATPMWTEVTEEQFDAMLGAVPPAYQAGGGFLVGEPYDHRECGVTGRFGPSFAGYVERGGKFYSVGNVTLAEFKLIVA